MAKLRTSEFWHSEKTAAEPVRRDCKDCRNAYRSLVHERQQQDPAFREKKRSVASRWYVENKDRAVEVRRGYNQREDVRVRKKERLVQRRASDPSFAEWEIKYRREHYRANRDRYFKMTEAWRAANPDKVSAINAARNAARRARIINAEGRYTPADIRAKLELQEFTCFWCDADVSGGKHTVDHYIPLNRGGTNHPANIVIACKTCNCTKRDMLPDEFRRYRAETV